MASRDDRTTHWLCSPYVFKACLTPKRDNGLENRFCLMLTTNCITERHSPVLSLSGSPSTHGRHNSSEATFGRLRLNEECVQTRSELFDELVRGQVPFDINGKWPPFVAGEVRRQTKAYAEPLISPSIR